MSLDHLTFPAAALAGLLSFLSPCILPLAPFWLVYLSGQSAQELRANPDTDPAARWTRIRTALAFAAGVITVFALFGLGATALGTLVANWRRELSMAAALVLVLFAGSFLGWWQLISGTHSFLPKLTMRPGSLPGGYLLGLAFGFGWTPCVGPVLAAILMLASGMGEIARGGLLLIAYGIGMMAPFVLAAAFAGPFVNWLAARPGFLSRMEKATGIALLVLAALIATDTMVLVGEFILRLIPELGFLG
ncbi:MAG: sulfite exporter TauE/SafE family protein [Hyphomicrobiaceae bacterium]|nr:sulfite exporter TauE/SafE family protein [Hyphomicrobiaceae bacterium]